MATRGSSRWRATCATPRSRRSTKARTRSSGWLLRGNSSASCDADHRGDAMTEPGQSKSLNRRSFLRGGAAVGVAVTCWPAVLRAQAATYKIGVIHPVTGPLAEPGQACRLGAQMALEAINAAGGIKSLGGMRLDMLVGDTQTKPDVGRTE